MPVDYSKGKIYKITSPHTDQVYIGSTCAPLLSHRLRGHINSYRRWQQGKYQFVSSFILFDLGDHMIELIELFPCTSSDELRAREQYWIREHGDRCCNNRKALCTAEEKKQEQAKRSSRWYRENLEKATEWSRKWREENQDRCREYQASYYMENREKRIDYQKTYAIENSEKVKLRGANWRAQNKDKIKARKSEKIQCECGASICKDGRSRHNRSNKHQTYLATLKPADSAQ